MTVDNTAGVELPARREDIELHTADGLTLVGDDARRSKSAGFLKGCSQCIKP